ncbi:L-lysine 2,3-aminomutase [Posidoniimonas polymericola]|uniref:L-lysine 2,3-aminomutase n=1 Tax=Posidoniimonas polymericola TaxID=2528002 RepID=A0A5C5ZF95_9BACT|nr:EF-P beta-lysylation protein EpmB [Posidoniimonas polymericola]TWT85760.1 L-lysine 2,3-aminomutase [Posidoniimonas polymericola]
MTSLSSPTRFVRPADSPPWKAELRQAVRDPAELARLLELPDSWVEPARAAAREFPLLAPRGYVGRMRPGDPADPLLRQVLPLADELAPATGFDQDPVGDAAAALTPGLLQKYQGRVLLVTTGACAVHCRYCFRRHYPYSESPKALAAWDEALAQIAADPTIHEVILSGGDPLTLVDETLGELARRIADIPHVNRLRVHTRLPVMIPSRVTDELLAWLTGTRLTPVMVLHANHANELDDAVNGEVARAIARLAGAGVPLLNQAVLLRGVNDTTAAQAELCERLVDHRVMPYYLHQLDKVAGAAHFETPSELGEQIITKLRARLPGYAVPRLVREEAGESSKTVIR